MPSSTSPTSAPRSVEALGRLRSIPNGFERSRTGGDILEAVERGLARDPATVPMPERSRGRGNTGAVVDLLKVLLKAVAEQEGVAPKIIATVEELEAIAESDTADVPSLHGWRRTLFGEKGPRPQERPARPRAGARACETAGNCRGLKKPLQSHKPQRRNRRGVLDDTIGDHTEHVPDRESATDHVLLAVLPIHLPRL